MNMHFNFHFQISLPLYTQVSSLRCDTSEIEEITMSGFRVPQEVPGRTQECWAAVVRTIKTLADSLPSKILISNMPSSTVKAREFIIPLTWCCFYIARAIFVPLQTDTICGARDNEIIDLCKGREPFSKALSANAKAIMKRTGQQTRFTPS